MQENKIVTYSADELRSANEQLEARSLYRTIGRIHQSAIFLSPLFTVAAIGIVSIPEVSSFIQPVTDIPVIGPVFKFAAESMCGVLPVIFASRRAERRLERANEIVNSSDLATKRLVGHSIEQLLEAHPAELGIAHGVFTNIWVQQAWEGYRLSFPTNGNPPIIDDKMKLIGAAAFLLSMVVVALPNIGFRLANRTKCDSIAVYSGTDKGDRKEATFAKVQLGQWEELRDTVESPQFSTMIKKPRWRRLVWGSPKNNG